MSGVASEGDSVYRVPTIANDIAYNPGDGKIYMSIPGIAGPNGNSIQTVDPHNGILGEPVWAGSEPSRLAISENGHALYVSLSVSSRIKRFITSTMESDLEYGIGSVPSGPFIPADMAVPPGYWNILAVVRSQGSNLYGIAIFNNSIQAPQTTPQSDLSNSLAFSDSASTLYATGTSTSAGLRRIQVDINGATSQQTSSVGANSRIKFSQGKIFTSRGQVIDPQSNTVLGVFASTINTQAFVPDSNGRAYYLVRENSPANTFTLRAYDINTFELIDARAFSMGGPVDDPTRMIRWGQNGLAMRTVTGQVFIFQTSLIPTPQPVPTPSSMPTPTPTPTPIVGSVDQINLWGNGIAYNEVNGSLYVSVPSTSPVHGNTIAVVDPVTPSIQSGTFIGSEPRNLKLSHDGSKLYVYLSGAREFRLFDTAINGAGDQFPMGPGDDVLNFDTSPSEPDVIAVSQSGNGVHIYDAGIRRPQSGGSGNSIAYSDSSSTIFNGGSTNSLHRLTVTSNGIGTSSTFNYTSGFFLKYHDGLIFGSRGGVLDPAAHRLIGSFPVPSPGNDTRFIVIPEHNRILYLGASPRRIYAYELDTFRLIGSISVPGNGTVTGFERVNSNGVAISQSNGPLFIVRSELVDPGLPVPPTTPTPTPTPIPTPTPDSPFIRRIDRLNNDMVLNRTDGNLYLSIPGQVKDGTGNTITRIDPATGEHVSSTFVGSEPTRLAISQNDQVLFTNLAGAFHVIRMFDTVNLTAGPQYPLTHVPSGSNPQVSRLVAVPGEPNSVVVSNSSAPTAIYDNGVGRPNTFSGGTVVFTSTPGLLYGFNSGGSPVRLSMDANGFTTLSSVGGLISGNDITFAEGKLFSANGRIVDPETNRIVGTLQTPSSTYAMAVDTAQRRVFIAGSDGIRVFNMDTFIRTGTIQVPGGIPSSVTRLVRWGENGLAMRVGGAQSYIQLIQSALVSEDGSVPTGVNFNNSGQSVSEGLSAASITVSRTGDRSGTTIVQYSTVEGTATAGLDFTPTTGILTFTPGEVSKIINIPLLNDNIFENGSETFSVELFVPAGENWQPLSPSSITISILDNDPIPRITPADAVGLEGPAGTQTTANVQVTLINRSVLPINVNYTTVSDTATAGIDFVAAEGVLTFAPLETTKTIPITLIGDNIDEEDETFRIVFSSPSNATILDTESVVTIVNFATVNSALFDYDGDGRSDVSVRRASTNTWYLLRGTAGYTAMQFGVAGDRMVPADYDGDGKTDVAVFRPSTGTWFIYMSQPQTFQQFGWGQDGDLPVPTDRDNDGKADLVIYRESNNTWYTRFANGTFNTFQFGVAGDKPMLGDFDGDGIGDVALFRPSNNNWYIIKSSLGFFIQTWGQAGDIPLTGDFDGDGATDQAVFRPSTGQWFLSRTTAGFSSQNWGLAGDIPVPADYDGDGKTDVAVFRPSNGTWYIVNSSAGILIQQFGVEGDVPTQSAYGS